MSRDARDGPGAEVPAAEVLPPAERVTPAPEPPMPTAEPPMPEPHTPAAERLADLHAETLDRLAALGRTFGEVVAASADSNADDEHDPEGATIGFERAQVGALRARAEHTLAEIDAAQERLEHGTYGRCAVCGRPIAPARLAARPTATRCITCASQP